MFCKRTERYKGVSLSLTYFLRDYNKDGARVGQGFINEKYQTKERLQGHIRYKIVPNFGSDS